MTVLSMAVSRSEASLTAKAFWRDVLSSVRPRAERVEPTVLTAQEQRRVLDLAGGHPRTRLAVQLALHAGLRHQEILHTSWGDLDTEAGLVRVTAKPAVGWAPKSHEERVIPMSAGLRTVIRLIHPDVPFGEEWVFPGEGGLPMRSYAEGMRGLFQAAGIADTRRPGLHMLRRTWATECLRKGMPLPDLMKLAGWTKLETVQRYLAPNREIQREVLDRLE
jgi:integrase/recombinase XerD